MTELDEPTIYTHPRLHAKIIKNINNLSHSIILHFQSLGYKVIVDGCNIHHFTYVEGLRHPAYYYCNFYDIEDDYIPKIREYTCHCTVQNETYLYNPRSFIILSDLV